MLYFKWIKFIDEKNLNIEDKKRNGFEKWIVNRVCLCVNMIIKMYCWMVVINLCIVFIFLFCFWIFELLFDVIFCLLVVGFIFIFGVERVLFLRGREELFILGFGVVFVGVFGNEFCFCWDCFKECCIWNNIYNV